MAAVLMVVALAGPSAPAALGRRQLVLGAPAAALFVSERCSAADAAAPAPELPARGARRAPRGAAALLRERAKTGVTRTGNLPAVVSPGIFADELRGVDDSSAVVGIAFEFPPSWTQALGPNIDLRNIQTSDGAFLIAAPLPRSARAPGASVGALPAAFFTSALFAADGKYGAYGSVDDARVVSSAIEVRKGVEYRRLEVKFSAPSFNANLVERRLLLSAAVVGGGVYMLCASALANRYTKVAPQLRAIIDSYDVRSIRDGRAAVSFYNSVL